MACFFTGLSPPLHEALAWFLPEADGRSNARKSKIFDFVISTVRILPHFLISPQSAYLAVAKRYKDAGRIHKIHLSTRPDYINEHILEIGRLFLYWNPRKTAAEESDFNRFCASRFQC